MVDDLAGAAPPEHVRPGVSRVPQDPGGAGMGGPSPPQLPGPRAPVGAARETPPSDLPRDHHDRRGCHRRRPHAGTGARPLHGRPGAPPYGHHPAPLRHLPRGSVRPVRPRRLARTCGHRHRSRLKALSGAGARGEWLLSAEELELGNLGSGELARGRRGRARRPPAAYPARARKSP